MTRGRLLLAISIVAVAAAVGVGLTLAGPPGAERDRRLDALRVEDLSSIARAVDVFYQRRHALPSALGDLPSTAGAVPIADPSTGQPYEYRAIAEKRYEVCASFARASEPRGSPEFWAHAAGRHCFQLAVRDVNR